MQLTDQVKQSGYYRVKVVPNQSATEIKEIMDDGAIKITLKAVPEKGKANQELIRFFAKELALPKNQIRISSGLTNRLKVVFVEMD
jgi:hypothetical protein